MTVTITAARGRLVRRHTASMRRAVSAARFTRATQYSGGRGRITGAHGRPARRPSGPGTRHPRLNRAALAKLPT
ncbi:hypothetical protein [Streptomyces mirabilis]|uniref:hypothetical protein n=1 Tax=Streptomyces mirabilis TaxID=68239 RepID=UPI0021C18097|nr:hypothetical protein [Streptomyces mirabilis]MCT9105366.1 hypothetical protein [Streptomyces mirabilis]